jgi:hypothetical protein
LIVSFKSDVDVACNVARIISVLSVDEVRGQYYDFFNFGEKFSEKLRFLAQNTASSYVQTMCCSLVFKKTEILTPKIGENMK